MGANLACSDGLLLKKITLLVIKSGKAQNSGYTKHLMGSRPIQPLADHMTNL